MLKGENIMIKTDERYVIASKTTPTKFPYDERNKHCERGDMTYDILEAWLYCAEDIAQSDFDKGRYNPKDFEIKKVNISYEVV
jgi:hypothetical protein